MTCHRSLFPAKKLIARNIALESKTTKAFPPIGISTGVLVAACGETGVIQENLLPQHARLYLSRKTL